MYVCMYIPEFVEKKKQRNEKKNVMSYLYQKNKKHEQLEIPVVQNSF